MSYVILKEIEKKKQDNTTITKENQFLDKK